MKCNSTHWVELGWPGRSLQSISGVEKLHALAVLDLTDCGVTSLQPLAELRAEGLVSLSIIGCREVQEELLEMPYVPAKTEDVDVNNSNVREAFLHCYGVSGLSDM